MTDPHRFAADLRLGRIDPGRGHEIATAFLEAGHDVPALYDLLAIERARLSWEAPPVLERLAAELGRPCPSPEEAWLFLARDVAARCVGGEVEPEAAVGELFGFWLEGEHAALAPAADLYVELEHAEAMDDERRRREAAESARRWLEDLAGTGEQRPLTGPGSGSLR